MWVVKYESHYKYAINYEFEFRTSSFIICYLVYQLYYFRYAMSIMPVRYICMHKKTGNVLHMNPKYLACTDAVAYRKLKKGLHV